MPGCLSSQRRYCSAELQCASHGQRIKKEGELYFRWCFSDLAMARAFVEQFGGTLYARWGATDRGEYRQAAGVAAPMK
jgi:hypothetical protein